MVPFCGRTICTWAHNSFHGIIGQRWLLLRFQIKISGGYICYKGISSNIWINSAGAVYNCTGGESSNCESPQKVWIGGENLLCSGEGCTRVRVFVYTYVLHIIDYVCKCDYNQECACCGIWLLLGGFSRSLTWVVRGRETILHLLISWDKLFWLFV